MFAHRFYTSNTNLLGVLGLHRVSAFVSAMGSEVDCVCVGGCVWTGVWLFPLAPVMSFVLVSTRIQFSTVVTVMQGHGKKAALTIYNGSCAPYCLHTQEFKLKVYYGPGCEMLYPPRHNLLSWSYCLLRMYISRDLYNQVIQRYLYRIRINMTPKSSVTWKKRTYWRALL